MLQSYVYLLFTSGQFLSHHIILWLSEVFYFFCCFFLQLLKLINLKGIYIRFAKHFAQIKYRMSYLPFLMCSETARFVKYRSHRNVKLGIFSINILLPKKGKANVLYDKLMINNKKNSIL